MLSLFLAYSLASKACAATPADDSTQSSSMDMNDSRTLLNIIWSCITTIFLCTWVAIHPNIPEPIDTSKMGFFKKANISMRSLLSNRLPVFICALLVPEYILAWAIRQFLVARDLGKWNDFTTTQAFFIVMGGFHYFPESTDMVASGAHPLDQKEVISMVDNGTIILPTEAEIKDRSKSDWIAKSLVLLQTTWFIVQCIARRIERLPTTELEIVTLAYTAVNFGIFIAWWDKPQLVDCPVRVSQPPTRTGSKEENEWFPMLFMYIIGGQDTEIDLHSERMVPRFYGGDMHHHYIIADIITLLVGVFFGVIHCIAWSFESPSHTETFLWRMSSAAITCVPVLLFLTTLMGELESLQDPEILSHLTAAIFPLSGVLYIAARIITVTLAFMNLSSAPPGVFQAVHWTTLIPHL